MLVAKQYVENVLIIKYIKSYLIIYKLKNMSLIFFCKQSEWMKFIFY